MLRRPGVPRTTVEDHGRDAGLAYRPLRRQRHRDAPRREHLAVRGTRLEVHPSRLSSRPCRSLPTRASRSSPRRSTRSSPWRTAKSCRRPTPSRPRTRASRSSNWSMERSGTLTDGGGFYYQSIKGVTDNRRRYLCAARRARQGCRRHRRVLGLAGDRHLLRRLHGSLTAAPAKRRNKEGAAEAAPFSFQMRTRRIRPRASARSR
jgi:hypothetical protein